MIHNLALIEAHGTDYIIRTLAGRDELAARVEEFFGIPREVVAEAVGALHKLQDPWEVPSNVGS